MVEPHKINFYDIILRQKVVLWFCEDKNLGFCSVSCLTVSPIPKTVLESNTI
jgi:hypothetical protein